MQTQHNRRLSWDAALHYPFESGWSLFRKIKELNGLQDHELVQLIAREPDTFRRRKLPGYNDSSWIDFDRFSDLLNVPAHELKNGFWDQLGISTVWPRQYSARFCETCMVEHQYHCIVLDLNWIHRCPWHGTIVSQVGTLYNSSERHFPRHRVLPELSINALLSLKPMTTKGRQRLIGHVLDYVHWWRQVQQQSPKADQLLSHLVTVGRISQESAFELTWQAGYAQQLVPLQYGSWVLQDIKPVRCRHTRVVDAGRSIEGRYVQNTVRDETGRSYRAIRRHIFARYVRKHRACLKALFMLSRDDLLKLAADGVCATCLAYVIWRMSIENLAILEGLYRRRDNDFTLNLTEPWRVSPSDDSTRLAFTYMQFFGIWAAIVDQIPKGGFDVTLQQIVASPQIVFADDNAEQRRSPLRHLNCIYPDAEDLVRRAGVPCKASWNLLSDEQQCVLRSHEWLNSVVRLEKQVIQVHAADGIEGVKHRRHLSA